MSIEALALLVITALAAAFRLWDISGNYFLLNDTTEQIARLRSLLHLEGDPYNYQDPPGPGVALAPFLVAGDYSIASAQYGIAFYGLMMVPAAYALARMLLPSWRLAALLLALFIAVNPALVATSRIGFFDVMHLTVGLAYLALVLTVGERRWGRGGIAACFLLGLFLVLMKEPNVILVGFGWLLLTVRTLQRRREPEGWAGVVLVAGLGALILLFFYAVGHFLQAEERFERATNVIRFSFLSQNFRPFIDFFAAPLETPATGFSFYFSEVDWSPLRLMGAAVALPLMLVGMVALVRRRPLAGGLMLAALTGLGGFYLFFYAWMSRFGLPILVALLFLLALGLEQVWRWVRAKPVSLLGAGGMLVAVGLAVSLGSSLADNVRLLRDWETPASYVDNNVLVWPEDVERLRFVLQTHPQAVVITSTAAFVDLVDSYPERERFDLARFGVERHNAPEALDEFAETVRRWRAQGRDILYVPGIWDIDDAAGAQPRGWGMYFNYLVEEQDAKLLYQGTNVYSNKQARPRPTFAIYLLYPEEVAQKRNSMRPRGHPLLACPP